jgi:hypothetical protein
LREADLCFSVANIFWTKIFRGLKTAHEAG